MTTSNKYHVIEVLHESKQSTIVRAFNHSLQKTFILKTYNATRRRDERLHREYEIGAMFNGSPYSVQYVGIMECYLIDEQQQQQAVTSVPQLFIIMEDDGGVNLSSIIPRHGLDIERFLDIALQMIRGIGEMHNRGVINRDIKPDNIVINTTTNRIKFIDFGNATLLHENSYSNTNTLEGTLAYISPEQTGRLNIPIDYRTDFYSLGITFYQLLSGTVPFSSKDAIKLIHSHIAKEPIPLHDFVQERCKSNDVVKSIPLPLSQMVSKLLQKNYDLRYQSAHGLLVDMELCVEQYRKHGFIEPFTIAEYDVGEKFTIPTKLYGRDKDLECMREAYNRACDGFPQLLIVSGWSGVGKTSLIAEIQSSVSSSSGYFVSGKFDQLAKGAYSALRHAFDSLIKHLVSEKNGREYWRNIIQEQLGANAQVVLDVLPGLETLIGRQAPAPPLGVIEAQTRFDRVFESFLSCFQRQEHPIVFFLDDLQWADGPSLHILEILMKSPKTKHVLLIVSYRENEVDDSHVAIASIEEIKKANVASNQISLEPLSFGVTHQWITDILRESLEKTKDLATAIYQKTHGNPFFVKMFMRSLYDERLIFHNWDHWEWDLEKIKFHPSTENVVELMVHRISLLSPLTRRLLQLASCIGNHFSLHTLELLEGSTGDELMKKIIPVIDSGLGYCLEGEFFFGHDRIQEAAYSGISEEEKKQIHLKLGFLLLDHAPKRIEDIENIFDIVGHLNKGLDIVLAASSSEKIMNIFKLNYSASIRAKNAIAYTSALVYCLSAASCLNALGDKDVVWEKYHSESFSLHQLLYQLYNLCNKDTEADEIINLLLVRAGSPCEKGEVYNMLITEKTIRTSFSEAIAIGRIALQYMGLEFPANTQECPAIEEKEFERIKTYLDRGDVSDILEHLPEMTDEYMLVVFKLLNNLLVSTFLSDRPLYSVVVIIAVRVSLEYGRNPETALAFCFYGGYLCSLPDPATKKLGYIFAKSALMFCDIYKTPALKSQVLHVAAILVYPWSQPISTLEHYCNAAYQCGLEGGETQYAGYSRYCALMTSFYRGDSLEDIIAKSNRFYGFVKGVGNVLAITVLECYKLAALKMMGDRCPKNEIEFLQREVSIIQSWKQQNCDYTVCQWHLLEAIRLYIYYPRELEETYKKLEEAEELLGFLNAHYVLIVFRFYSSLLCIRMIEDLRSDVGILPKSNYDIQKLMRKIEENQSIIQDNIPNCPQNFNHKYLLVEAERKRIEGSNNPFELMHMYDTAIEDATQNGFTLEAALGNELAYHFWVTKPNKEYIAKGYLDVACIAYSKWGATPKAFNLKISSPSEVKAYNLPLSTTIHNTSTVNVVGAMLDLDMIIKASQIISSTIDMDKLLFNILKMLIEYAGAQRGCIILEGRVEAEYKPNSPHDGFKIESIETLKSIPIETWENGCYEIIDHVIHSNETIVLNNASVDRNYQSNEYINKNGIKSVMCMPVTQQANATILYLENNIISGAFTEQRIRVLSILTSQMAISLENAKYFKAQMNAAEQIAEMQKVRALEAEAYRRKQDELTDRICHEIRNPLNGVFGNLEFLKSNAILLRNMVNSNVADPSTINSIIDDMLDSVESIDMCAKHQKVITDDVLTLSKLEADQIQLNIIPFSPNGILQATAKMFEAAITKKNLKMHLHSLKEDIVLLSDPHRITQALINLVSNSVKFTHTGSISLGAQIISIPDSEREVFLQFSIQDTGVGMSERELRNIFSPFKQGNQRVYSEYGGSGLGLFITKILVQLMNGEMFVESEEHVGTTFTFNIRCSIAPKDAIHDMSIYDKKTRKGEQVDAIEQEALGLKNRQLNILVAEDNLINQKILIRMLNQAGYKCFIANNGKEAVSLNSEHNIDVILMDIEMPVMSGLEATQLIREQEEGENKHVIIIGISGNARKEHVDKALDVGMDDYLTKPVKRQDVLRKIAEHASMPE